MVVGSVNVIGEYYRDSAHNEKGDLGEISSRDLSVRPVKAASL